VERSSGVPADDRFRETGNTFITGFRIRAGLVTNATVRFRIIFYKPVAEFSFQQGTVPGYKGLPGHIAQAFVASWGDAYDAGVYTPAGPFSYLNLSRTDPPAKPVWHLETGDGTHFAADGVRGPHRILADWKYESPSGSTNNSAYEHPTVKDLDWYVDIRKIIRTPMENLNLADDTGYQCLLMYSAATVHQTGTLIGSINHLSVKLYYR